MHACAAQPCLTRQAGQCTSLFNFARCTFNAALHHIKFCGATDHAVSAIAPVWTKHYFVQLHQHEMRLSGRIVQVTYRYAWFPRSRIRKTMLHWSRWSHGAISKMHPSVMQHWSGHEDSQDRDLWGQNKKKYDLQNTVYITPVTAIIDIVTGGRTASIATTLHWELAFLCTNNQKSKYSHLIIQCCWPQPWGVCSGWGMTVVQVGASKGLDCRLGCCLAQECLQPRWSQCHY